MAKFVYGCPSCKRTLWIGLEEIVTEANHEQAVSTESTRKLKCAGCGTMVEILKDRTIRSIATFTASSQTAPVHGPQAGASRTGIRSSASAADRGMDYPDDKRVR